jgi:hypothetical protein
MVLGILTMHSTETFEGMCKYSQNFIFDPLKPRVNYMSKLS